MKEKLDLILGRNSEITDATHNELMEQILALFSVSECDFCVDGKVDKPQYICQDCEDRFLDNSGR